MSYTSYNNMLCIIINHDVLFLKLNTIQDSKSFSEQKVRKTVSVLK